MTLKEELSQMLRASVLNAEAIRAVSQSSTASVVLLFFYVLIAVIIAVLIMLSAGTTVLGDLLYRVVSVASAPLISVAATSLVFFGLARVFGGRAGYLEILRPVGCVMLLVFVLLLLQTAVFELFGPLFNNTSRGAEDLIRIWFLFSALVVVREVEGFASQKAAGLAMLYVLLVLLGQKVLPGIFFGISFLV